MWKYKIGDGTKPSDDPDVEIIRNFKKREKKNKSTY